MKKKQLIIISIAVALIAISIAVLFMLRDADESNTDFDSLNSVSAEVPNKLPDESYDNIAENMGITREELDEILTTPLDLTPEQEADIQEILERNKAPEIEQFIEDDDPNDNIYTYIDKDGNEGEMTVDIPEMTDEEVEDFYDDLDAFLEQLENGDIDLEDIAPPQLGGETEPEPEYNEDNDPNIGTGAYEDMINDGENYIGIGPGGTMGEVSDEEEVDYWVEKFGMTADEINNLTDEEKIALGFTQYPDGTWVDKYYFMLPAPQLTEEALEEMYEQYQGSLGSG